MASNPWDNDPIVQPQKAGGQLFTLPKPVDPDAAINHQLKALQLQKAMKDATKEQVSDAQVESLAKLYASNKLIPPTRPNEVAQKAIARAMELDPNYDPELATNRQQAIKDFSGAGKASQSIGAINRLAANLQELKSVSDKMGGPNLGFSPLNKLVAGTEQLGEPELRARYDALLPEISNQFDLIMKSNKGSPTVSGIDEAMKGLGRARSQDERNAAFEEVGKAVHGAIAPLKDQWNAAYGGTRAPPMWISKDAGDFFGKLDPQNKDDYGGNDWRGLPGLKGVGDQPTNPPPGNPPGKFTPEMQKQFFDLLQNKGPDAANAYLGQYGLAMKDKTAADRPYAKTLSPPNSYAGSYLSQGMSGANEGLASVLGAPVDLMTGAMNLIPKGINAVANTNIPTIQDPFAGSQSFKRGLSEIGSILPGSDDPSKQFVRRVGQSVGASVIPSLGAGGSAARIGAGLLSGLGGGVGAATAQQIAPGSPGAEMAGDVIGSGLTGLGLVKAAQRAAQRGIEATVPTVDELKSQASNLYQKAEQGGVTATPEQTQQLADGFRKTLQDEGQIGPNGAITSADTNTTKAHNLIQQYAGQPMTPKQMNTVRTVLADSRQSPDASDRRLGNMLLNQFDDWASPLAPQFDQARDVSSRYLQTQDLEKARDLAGAQASQFTGSGLENALRTQYRALDRGNIKGQNYFAPDVTDAIQKVARGTALSNTLRGIGKLAPTGVVPGMGDLGGGAMAAMMTGSPEAGGAVAGGMAGLGVLGRVGATRMGLNAANQAELIARNGGALDKAPLLPKAVIDYLAAQAAAQQAKYLNGNQQQ